MEDVYDPWFCMAQEVPLWRALELLDTKQLFIPYARAEEVYEEMNNVD